jgi:hypothetical protein
MTERCEEKLKVNKVIQIQNGHVKYDRQACTTNKYGVVKLIFGKLHFFKLLLNCVGCIGTKLVF